MKGVYTLCESPEAAQRAVDDLQVQGIGEDDITVFSSQPYIHHRFGQKDHHTRIQWISVMGGATGFLTGLALIVFVQVSWPLQTGGMPIIAVLASAIPIYELTMLGTVLATVLALFVTAGLPRRLSRLYDPAVSEGKILVGIAVPPANKITDIEHILSANGELKRVD